MVSLYPADALEFYIQLLAPCSTTRYTIHVEEIMYTKTMLLAMQ